MLRLHTTRPHYTEGFALLVTLIVVSVILAIGLSILDLSIKQVRLSANAKDSENAFHAANAGLECGRFNRLRLAEDMELGREINPSCFGDTVNNSNPQVIFDDPVIGQSFLYTWEFTWGSGLDVRCSRLNILVASTTPDGGGLTSPDMLINFPGFENDTHLCEASARCTVISSQGFSRSCANRTQIGTVQREVLLEF